MNAELYKKLVKNSEENYHKYLPSISIDCVVFGFYESCLKVLLVRLQDSVLWGLPGGYLLKNEELTDGANRILQERTGAQNIYLNQFQTFGHLNRSEGFFKDFAKDVWYKQRFVSISYYALINHAIVVPQPDEFSDACEWIAVDHLPNLMMDHDLILRKATEQLRQDLNYKPIGLNLLPEKFTMPELLKLYEILLGKKLNRGNFYRKMKQYDILDKLNETKRGGAHKAPDLYRFNEEKYNLALQNGLQEAW